MANIESVKLPNGNEYNIKDAISGYVEPVTSPTADNLASLTASGGIADSGIAKTDVATKATSPTNGHLASLDANGGLVDSGFDKAKLVNSDAIAPTEDEATASQAYAVGKHFFRGGDYCTAIAQIAQNASFTLNTNYKVVPLSDEIQIQDYVTVTGTYANNIKARKMGSHLVSVRVAIGGSNNIANGTTLGTLPSDIKPLSDAVMSVLTSASGGMGNVLVNANGVVTYYGSANATVIYGSIIYEI